MVYLRVKLIFADEKKFDSCMYMYMLVTSTTVDRCVKSED